MNILVTVLTVILHLLVGPFRFVGRAVRFVLRVIDLIATILASITMRFLFSIWNAFADDYQETWNRVYRTLAKPECSICGQSENEGELSSYQECCEKWAHDKCHASDTVFRLIKRGALDEAGALFAMRQRGEGDFSLPLVLRLMRDANPYRQGRYQMVQLVKRLGREVNQRSAMEFLMARIMEL